MRRGQWAVQRGGRPEAGLSTSDARCAGACQHRLGCAGRCSIEVRLISQCSAPPCWPRQLYMVCGCSVTDGKGCKAAGVGCATGHSRQGGRCAGLRERALDEPDCLVRLAGPDGHVMGPMPCCAGELSSSAQAGDAVLRAWRSQKACRRQQLVCSVSRGVGVCERIALLRVPILQDWLPTRTRWLHVPGYA